MSELTAFNAYCKSNGINVNGQLATEDLAPAFSAGYKARQDTLRQRVAKLEKELNEVRKAEVALLKPNPLCDTGCMLSCKMEADYYEKQITTMKSELREALACGEDGDWQSARRIINTALGEEK